MDALLSVRDAWFRYPGVDFDVIRGARLDVDRGEVVAIIGPNGCGKTTLLFLMAGLFKPHKGDVLLDSKSIYDQLPEARRRIGLVFQDPDDQLFNSTVYDEIAFALRQLSFSEREIDARVKEVTKLLGISDLLDRSPYRLSFGEKRMVTVASVIVYKPDLLLLDEPTANLSSRAVERIERLIKDWREKGKSVVVTSHNVDFVARIADRVFVMNMGKIIGGGDVRAVLGDEDLLKRVDLRVPFPVRVYRTLGGSDSHIPLTLNELKCSLDRLFKNTEKNED